MERVASVRQEESAWVELTDVVLTAYFKEFLANQFEFIVRSLARHHFTKCKRCAKKSEARLNQNAKVI